MHELQIIIELAEARKDFFGVDMEVVREQLQEMEAKSIRLEKEISFLKAKEQKLDQPPGMDIPAAKRNLEQFKKQ